MWEKHSHKQCIKEALRHAEQVCLTHKCRLTPIRRGVLQIIWESHKPIKAYSILAQLSSDDFLEKPPTVYRALQFLLDNHLIHRIESQNAYIGCNASYKHLGSKFFICDECNEVEELAEPAINKALRDAGKRQGLSPSLINIEIHGTCAQCSQQ